MALRDYHHVELQHDVRFVVAALHEEEPQGVVGVVGEGVATPVLLGTFTFGVLKFLKDGGFFDGIRGSCFSSCVIGGDCDIAGGEVDGQAGGVVDAAQVGHQHIVNEHPHIVVSGELIGGRLSAIGRAAVSLGETGGHCHAEVVVDERHTVHSIAPVRQIFGQLTGGYNIIYDLRCENAIFIKFEHLIRGVEGEELAG